MSASISHEIKNVLAIVNENAGLLEDLTLRSSKDMTIDPERLNKISQAITGQVRRADAIIKNMNRFAHTTHEPVETVNLQEILELVISLAGRSATGRGITLTHSPAMESVPVTTAPYQLENLIWLSLDFAMDAAGEGKTVHLVVKEAPDRVGIEFSHLEGLSENLTKIFPGYREMALLGILDADLALDRKSGLLNIILPKAITIIP